MNKTALLEAPRINILVWVMVLYGLIIITLPSISAAEWDNVKSYDSAKREVTITNALGMGGTIAKIKLNTALNNYVIAGSDRKVAELEFYNFDNSYIGALKNMEFYDLKKNNIPISRSFTYKYQVLKGYKTEDTYNTCASVIDGRCIPVKNGTYEIPIYDWKKFKELSELPINQNVKVGIFTDVYKGDRVEWIPTFFGVRINEWAVWTESLNTNLERYWKLDDATGKDEIVSNNLSLTAARVAVNAGIISGGYNFTGEYKPTTWNPDTFKNWTINLWYQYNSSFGNYEFLLANQPDNAAAGNGRLAFMQAPSNQMFIYANAPSGTPPNGYVLSEVLGTWYMLTLRVNDTHVSVLKDGAKVAQWTATFDANNQVVYLFGNTAGGNTGKGKADEIGFWSRYLTDEEIVQLYNGSTGITYVGVFETPATFNLITPPINYVTNLTNIFFNCTGMSNNGNITNMSLFIDNTIVKTVTNGISNFSEVSNFTTNTEGAHTWNCSISDEGASSPYSSTTRGFTVDLTKPNVTLIYPNVSSFTTFNNQYNFSINVTSKDANLNACTYKLECGTAEVTPTTIYTCNANFTNSITTGGNCTYTFTANDTAGNLNLSQWNYYLNFINVTTTATSGAFEGYNLTFSMTVKANLLTSVYSNITLNGLVYELINSSSNSTYYYATKQIQTPSVDADTALGYNFNYSINGLSYSTANATAYIYNLPDISILANCEKPALNFTLYDEENFTELTGTFNYNFYYGLTNSTFSNLYGNFTGSRFSLCINDTLSPNWTIGSGEIHYYSEGYVDRRYYIYSGKVITNVTELIPLYDLLSADQTSFKLEVEDTSLNPYVDKYTSLLRWYPELNQYKIVDMGKTDTTGTTVMHVRTEDVDYRVGVYEKNGTLISLDDPTRMICLVNPCTYTLKVSPTDDDFTSFLKIQYTLSYNETSGLWSFIYSDTSGVTQSMNMTIYKDTGTSSIPVCSAVTSGSVGVITCDTSAYTSGILRAVVQRIASPPVTIASKIISLTTTAFKSSFGLWLTILIAIPVILFLTFISPIAAIIGGVIAFIPAFYFGSINIGIFGGIAILGGIVAHFLKRIS